jgi:hypothetical protein
MISAASVYYKNASTSEIFDLSDLGISYTCKCIYEGQSKVMAAAESGGRMEKIASVQRQRQRQRQRRPVRLKARAAFDAMGKRVSRL